MNVGNLHAEGSYPPSSLTAYLQPGTSLHKVPKVPQQRPQHTVYTYMPQLPLRLLPWRPAPPRTHTRSGAAKQQRSKPQPHGCSYLCASSWGGR